MLLERPEGDRIALCVLERRSATVWIRRGHAGGKGRITSIPADDDAAAETRLAAELAALLAEGFVVTDEAATVSGAFRSAHAPKRERRLDPREVASRIERGIPPLPAGFARVLDALCEAAAVDTTARLARIELDGEEGASDVRFELRYAAGSGENVDDYAFEGFGFVLTLARAWPGESDGVELDVFEHGLRRVAGAALVMRFGKGVRALPAFAELGAIDVVAIARDEA